MQLIQLADKLNIVIEKTNVAAYDFNFELFFACGHPTYLPDQSMCVLRTGALADYAQSVETYAELGLVPVNSIEQHVKASELSAWYPLIADLTPKSAWYASFPDAGEIEALFGWPVFIKGTRQTSKHNPDLCVARTPEAYRAIAQSYRDDPILHWQDIAVRELVDLKPLAGSVPGKVRPSVEFRSFWWKGTYVGHGHYWYQLPAYSEPDIDRGLAMAEMAARRLDVPFLVIDIAKTAAGAWTIIECNDAQESGYTGIVPQVMWQNILEQL